MTVSCSAQTAACAVGCVMDRGRACAGVPEWDGGRVSGLSVWRGAGAASA